MADEGDVYDVVDEAEYEELVEKRRQREDFVVDDGKSSPSWELSVVVLFICFWWCALLVVLTWLGKSFRVRVMLDIDICIWRIFYIFVPVLLLRGLQLPSCLLGRMISQPWRADACCVYVYIP